MKGIQMKKTKQPQKKNKVTLDNSNIFSYLYTKLFKFNTYNQNLKTDNPESPIGLNVYSCEGKIKDFVKKQNRIHKIMKYCILLPGIKLLNWILGKHLTHTVPTHQTVNNDLKVNNKHLINVQLFDTCYDNTLKDWHDTFLCKAVSDNCQSSAQLGNSHLKNRSVQLLLKSKQFLNTFVCNDTAYLSFFDMLSYNYAKVMIDHHKSNINHLLYNSKSINDIRYFILRGMIPSQNIELVNKLVDGHLLVQEIKENEVEQIYHLSDGNALYLGLIVKKPSGTEIKNLIKPVIDKMAYKSEQDRISTSIKEELRTKLSVPSAVPTQPSNISHAKRKQSRVKK